MGRRGKRIREIEKMLDSDRTYSILEAIDKLKACPPPKFDQSVDIALKLGVDPRKADQNVRSTVTLPNGTGKKVRILVFARGEKVQEALDAGADFAGDDEYLDKVSKGWTDFDAVITTPDMMRDVGKLGKILGPRGLMPTPKAGTVTKDITKAVAEIKAGKIEFKVDKHSVLNNGVGKISFDTEKLRQNILAFVDAVQRAKPPGAKGIYMQSMYISSTMGPGLEIDLRLIESK